MRGMMSDETHDRSNNLDAASIKAGSAFLKEISTETLTILLIKKGLLTPAELLEQERTLRCKATGDSKHTTYSNSSRSPGFARHWASKKRWRRKFTSALFGWEWKKLRQEKVQG